MSLTRVRANKILLCLCLIGAHFITYAHAQNKNITGMEKGVLAFYKLSGIKPDFNKWVKTELIKQYGKTTIPTELIKQEELRLQYGLGTYNPKHEILKINTKILSQLLTSNDKTYLASRFPGRAAQKAPYFPYHAGHIWVAVIINKLENYLLLELNEHQKKKLLMLMPQKKQPSDLNMELYIRPVSAQAEPVEIDGLQQHLMLGEIAYLAFKKPALAGQENDSIIWEYYAPWYRYKDEQDLLNILESP